jgi:drug/metabolite transporter (DMT)-like permease
LRWNLAVAALAASWGLIAVIVREVELESEVLVFYRLSLAALAILAVVALLRRLDVLRVPALRGRLVLVGVTLAAHWFLFFETIKLSSVAVAVLTVYTAPIFLALLAPLVLPEARSWVALAALVPAGAGLALVALAGEGGTHPRPLALATGLAAALTYAALVIGTKSLTGRLTIPAITFWNYLIATAAVSPFLLGGERLLPEGEEIVYLVLLGAVFTALSGFVYVWLLRRVNAQTIGILAYIEPVSAALLAWALLGEELGPQVVLGGALIIAAGVAVVLLEPADAAAVEAAPVAPG